MYTASVRNEASTIPVQVARTVPRRRRIWTIPAQPAARPITRRPIQPTLGLTGWPGESCAVATSSTSVANSTQAKRGRPGWPTRGGDPSRGVSVIVRGVEVERDVAEARRLHRVGQADA